MVKEERLLRANIEKKKELYREESRHIKWHLIKHFQIGKIVREAYFKWIIGRNFTTNGNIKYIEINDKLDLTNLKLCVYTCIVGQYDMIQEPLFKEDGVDYFIFTDLEVPKGSVWQKIDISQWQEYKEYGPYKLNRLIKMMPERFLNGYDYSMYVDGSIYIAASVKSVFENMGQAVFAAHGHSVRDCAYDEMCAILHSKMSYSDLVEKQIAKYHKEGFPHHYGLFENMVLIRKHGEQDLQHVMDLWWQEYCEYPTRDQNTLPYVMWKANFDKTRIVSLGDGFGSNPRFFRTEHNGDPRFRSDKL